MVFPVAVELRRQAGARQLVPDRHAVGLEPGLAAAPEWRRGAECQQVRQEITDLAHQINPQIVVLDADMNMHAADQQSPRDGLHALSQDVVAILFGMLL